MGVLKKAQGDSKKARLYLEESLKILEDLHKTTPTPRVSRVLKEVQETHSELSELKGNS
jgi:hypothetical protein